MRSFLIAAAIIATLAGCAGDERQKVKGIGTGRDQYPPSKCAGPCPPIPQPNNAGQPHGTV